MLKLTSITTNVRRISTSTKVLASNWLSKHKIRQTWTKDNEVLSPFNDLTIPNCTLVEMIWNSVERWPTKTAVICSVTDKSYTYEELYYSSRNFGANLKKKFDIHENDCVAIMLPNVAEYPKVLLGILSAGGIATTINPIYTAHEIQRQVELSNPKAIIVSPANVKVAKEALKLAKRNTPIIAVRSFDEDVIPDTIEFNELTEKTDTSVLNSIKRTSEDTCLLPYSSGTTGLPKGVELINKNIVSNILQQDIDELRQYHFTTATNQDSVLVSLPLFHSFGLSIVMLHKLFIGTRLVMLPKFQPQLYLDCLIKYKINLLYTAPPIILFLGSFPGVTKEHLINLRSVTCGAAPLAEADINRLLERTHGNLTFTQGYGLTETGPLSDLVPFGHDAYTSVGFAVPNVRHKIIDNENRVLGPNEIGELLIKGPNVMKGYSANEEANRAAFTDDGYFKSGDLARIDEIGQVYILDRLKELIKVKGFQVPPAELEGVLKEHDIVLDAAVVGADDSTTGEVPVAFVVLKDGCKPDEKKLLEFVAERVAPYKKIKKVTFLDSIPKNPSGKILRRVLKEQYC